MIYSSIDKQTCAICNKEFAHNKNGKFTNHLWNNHDLTLHQYLIKYCYTKEELSCKTCGEQVNLRI